MQLQTAGMWLRGLSARLRSAAETTVSGRALRPWAPEPPPAELRESAELYASVDTGPQIVLDGPPSPAPAPTRTPRPFQRAGEFGKQLAPRAAALGRQLAPQAAAFGRQLGPLARRGATATGQGLRATGRRLADLRPLLRLLGRFLATILAGIGGLTVRVLGALARGSTVTGDRIAGALQRNQAVLFALFVRAMWWTAPSSRSTTTPPSCSRPSRCSSAASPCARSCSSSPARPACAGPPLLSASATAVCSRWSGSSAPSADAG
jgi:hypothetical protein